MKRTMIAVIAGLVVFGGTFAFAATLGAVTTGTLGASAAVVASCDTNGVNAAFGAPAWDATNKQYDVSSVNITSIDAACNTDAIRVTVTDSTGASLGEATGTVASGAASLTFATPISAQAVEGLNVVIAS